MAPPRTTFDIKPDTHLELMNVAQQAVLDGTSKWSCKIAITGREFTEWEFYKSLGVQMNV